jgi:RNA polymerase sigma-70 factor (ECF subfamily)
MGTLNLQEAAMSHDPRETLLVLQAQLGDAQALDELFRSLQEPLYRYIVGLVGEASLAEDILQEVFLIIYRKIGWLREAHLFRPWCYRLTTRETFRRLKRERRWRNLVREDDVLVGIEARLPPESPDEELLGRLPQLLGSVSPASRAVLALHYLDQQTLDEIADSLGLAVGTVKSRLAYGLATLRTLIPTDRE